MLALLAPGVGMGGGTAASAPTTPNYTKLTGSISPRRPRLGWKD